MTSLVAPPRPDPTPTTHPHSVPTLSLHPDYPCLRSSSRPLPAPTSLACPAHLSPLRLPEPAPRDPTTLRARRPRPSLAHTTPVLPDYPRLAASARITPTTQSFPPRPSATRLPTPPLHVPSPPGSSRPPTAAPSDPAHLAPARPDFPRQHSPTRSVPTPHPRPTCPHPHPTSPGPTAHRHPRPAPFIPRLPDSPTRAHPSRVRSPRSRLTCSIPIRARSAPTTQDSPALIAPLHTDKPRKAPK